MYDLFLRVSKYHNMKKVSHARHFIQSFLQGFLYILFKYLIHIHMMAKLISYLGITFERYKQTCLSLLNPFTPKSTSNQK